MRDRPPNIRHLAALAATVRHGSLNRAARAVNLSQPALTQAISGLETELGVTLFDRGPGGMTPTEPAILLTQRAEAAIAHIGSSRVTGTQVRAFLIVVRAGSFAAAAEVSGLSAPTLHRAVSDLSVALGQRLFDRRGRTVVLTEAGRRRARSFKLAMAELRSGLAEVSEWQGNGGDRITIGAMSLSRAKWLPETIARFSASHPGTQISVHEGSHSDLSGPLRDGEIDLLLGALRENVEVDDLVQEPIFEDRPVIVMRGDHPSLSGSRAIADLLSYKWLLPSRQTPLRRNWEKMLLELGLEPPRIDIECGSAAMVRQLLLSGDFLSLLSPSQVSVEMNVGLLTSQPTPMPLVRTIGFSTRLGWRPTPLQAEFIATLRMTGQAIDNNL